MFFCQTLEAFGVRALTPLLREFQGKALALEALDRQSSAFKNFVHYLSSADLSSVEPLPYRRVLPEHESAALWLSLESRWGVRGQGYGWYPINEAMAPEGAIALHEELWRARGGDKLLLQFFETTGVQRYYLLRELGPPDYEIERSIVTPYYDGSELF